jgi:peptide/nickel transport system permease protein
VASKGFIFFALRKFATSTITLIATFCLNFFIFRMVPGDPIRMMFRDPRVSIEQMQLYAEKFGLNQSLWGQFAAYMQQLFQGDLGISFWQKRPVIDVIADRIPQTLLLVVTALAIAVVIGILLGTISGWKSGSKLDSIILAGSLSMYSIPAFALGLVLLLIFAFYLTIFPLGGMSTPASGLSGFAYWGDVFWHMCLPAVTIMFWYVGEYVLLTRSSMMDTLDQDYIITARAKGLKEFSIMKNHALRNALLPVITITGVNLAFAVAGVIEVETVFAWPGVGRLVYDAIMQRDYPLLQGTFLLFSVTVIFANFLIDLIYGYIDPRIKVGAKE